MSTPAGAAWPNALAVAADLIDERGFSPRYLEDPVTGALAADRALQIALGYVWKELERSEDDDSDDETSLVFIAPDKETRKLYNTLSAALLKHLSSTTELKVPSIGFWNATVAEPESVSLALRIAAAQFQASRARVARFQTLAKAKSAAAAKARASAAKD